MTRFCPTFDDYSLSTTYANNKDFYSQYVNELLVGLVTSTTLRSKKVINRTSLHAYNFFVEPSLVTTLK